MKCFTLLVADMTIIRQCTDIATGAWYIVHYHNDMLLRITLMGWSA